MLKVLQKIIKNEFLLLTLLVIYSFHILLQTGFNGDDAYNAQIAGRMIDESYSLPETLLAQTTGWFLDSKRIVGGYFFVYPIFYYFHDFESINFITISFVLLSILLFYKFFTFSVFVCTIYHDDATPRWQRTLRGGVDEPALF